MAVSSLSKMTVPLGVATDQSNAIQGLLMPKLKYRFRVTFANFGISTPVTEITKQVMNATRPSVSFADIDIPIYNSTLKVAGKYSWENMTVEVRDDASGTVSKLVGEQLQKQLDFLEQSSASSGIDYKFMVVLEMLDGGNGNYAPNVLETWNIYGCYLQAVDYGDLAYDQSEVVTIKMTIRFDNALQGTGQGVGAVVGRTLGDVVTGTGAVNTSTTG